MAALATRTQKAMKEERCALACGPLSVSTASSRSVTGRSLAAILPGRNRLAVSAAENRTVCQPCLCKPLGGLLVLYRITRLITPHALLIIRCEKTLDRSSL